MTTAPTINYEGATVRVPFVGIGIVKEQVRDFYAVDIPIGSVNMRVWRKSHDLKVLALVVKNTSESIKNGVSSPVSDKLGVVIGDNVNVPFDTLNNPIPELTVITPETPDAAVHIPRDNASPEPRTLVVVAPVLRLFSARPAVERLEMVA